MKIFIIGGTGFLGSSLVPRLLADNHQITVLTRSNPAGDANDIDGLSHIRGDILKPQDFVDSLREKDLVINIAMPKVIPGERITVYGKRFRQLREQTTMFFQNSIAIARKLDVPIIITKGASFRTKSGETADETWPLVRDGIPKIGELTDPLVEGYRAGIIEMLPGQIYGNGGMFRNHMMKWMLDGKYRIIGKGENSIPRIHVEDCAAAYACAVRRLPLGEKYILADDVPCTVNEFTNAITDGLGIPRCGHLPAFPVRLLKGNLVANTILMNCIVSNRKAKQELDWELAYLNYRNGLAKVLEEIKRETGSVQGDRVI